MKKIFAIVPVKPLEEGKSRLRSVLSQSERCDFNGLLLERTLSTLSIFPGVERTIVVSRSEAVLASARRRRMVGLQETSSTLNAALSFATRKAVELEATTIIVVPSDLPLLEPSELERLANLGARDWTFVIVPDAARRGTNLLVTTPPCPDIFHFGEGSFLKHQELARSFGFNVLAEEDYRIAFDVDEPADYDRWALMRSARGASTLPSPSGRLSNEVV